MKNKEFIDQYVDALVNGNSRYLWDNKEFRNIIVEDDEKDYLKIMIQKRLKEMHENTDSEFKRNEKQFVKLLKKLGLETAFP